MTGLYNRGQANAQFFWEVEHLQDSVIFFAIMLDVDKFKSINDCYTDIWPATGLLYG